MAAAVPAAAAGAPAAVTPAPAAVLAPPAPVRTFMERYWDGQYDTEGGDYQRLLTHFDPMSPRHFTPAQLLESVLSEPDDNSRAVLMHWQDPSQPGNPGRVVVLHGFKRYPWSPGGAATPWDNRVYCWFQDVIEGSAPKLFEVPNGNMFAVAQPTDGTTTYRVYDPPTLAALYGANPQLVVASVPGVGAAGTDVVQTSYAFPLPFMYMAVVRPDKSPAAVRKALSPYFGGRENRGI
jgi:hypothetical protein